MTLRLPEDFKSAQVWIVLYMTDNYDRDMTDRDVKALRRAAKGLSRHLDFPVYNIEMCADDAELSFTFDVWAEFRRFCSQVLNRGIPLPPEIGLGDARGVNLKLSGDREFSFREEERPLAEDLCRILDPYPTLRGPRLLSDSVVSAALSKLLDDARV